MTVTIELDEDLVRKAEAVSEGDLARIVTEALSARLQSNLEKGLHQRLIDGCIEDAELDKEICSEWEHIDREMLAREPWE